MGRPCGQAVGCSVLLSAVRSQSIFEGYKAYAEACHAYLDMLHSRQRLLRAHVPAGSAIAISARLPFDTGDLVQIARRSLEPDIELAL